MANYTTMPKPLRVKLPNGDDSDVGFLLYQGDLTKLGMLTAEYLGCRAYNPEPIKDDSGVTLYDVGWYQVNEVSGEFVWKKIYDPSPSSAIPIVYEMPTDPIFADSIVVYEGSDTTVAPIYHHNHMYLGTLEAGALVWIDLMSGKLELPGTAGSILHVDAVGEPKWSEPAVDNGDIQVWDSTAKKYKPSANSDNIPTTPSFSNTIPYSNEYGMGKFNIKWTDRPTEDGQLLIFDEATGKWKVAKSGGNVPTDPALTGQILVSYPDVDGVPRVSWTGQPLVDGHSPVWDTETHTWTFDFGGKVKVVDELPDKTVIENAGYLYLYNGPESQADSLFTSHVYYLDTNLGTPVYIDLSARRVEECANVDYITTDDAVPDKSHLIWNKDRKMYEHKMLEVNRYTDVYIGEIKAFATTDVPEGWLVCDGTEYEIAAYPDLYRKIGKLFDDCESLSPQNYIYVTELKQAASGGDIGKFPDAPEYGVTWYDRFGVYDGIDFKYPILISTLTAAQQALVAKAPTDEYHFRVPNLLGRFVEGSNLVEGVGIYTRSTIPNGKGGVGSTQPWNGGDNIGGAFYVSGTGGLADGGDARGRAWMDLNRSSNTYTNNNHKVQPPSVRFIYAICASMHFTADEDITGNCTLYGHDPDKTTIIKRDDVIEANIYLDEMSTTDSEKVICVLPDGMKSAYYRGIDTKHIDDIHIEAGSDRIVQSKGDGTPSPVLITFTLE